MAVLVLSTQKKGVVMSAIGRREQEEELSRIVGKKVTKVSFSEEKMVCDGGDGSRGGH